MRTELGRLCIALGALVTAGAAISFAGWVFDVPRLTDWFGSDISIQPNTSVLLILSGGALMLFQAGHARIVVVLGGFIALAGALTLLQYVVGADFGFNHQLMFGRDWGQYTTVSPGRMGPPASTSFTLIGVALLLLGLRPASARVCRVVPLLGIAVCVICAFSIVGHLLGALRLFTVPWLTAIALQTALMLAAVAAGLVLCAPEQHPLRLLLSDSGAGALGRRILPAMILLPPLLGLLRMTGEELGYYDTAIGVAIMVLGMTILGVGLLWWALLALARHEASDRENARALLREQKLVAETLRDADQRKNEFLAILAHELRGPLAPLRNSLELLKRTSGDALLVGRAHGIMDRQLSHLARLVEDLLDVSRITRGRIEIRKEAIDLGSLLQACVDACRPTMEGRDQQLSLTLPPTPIRVDADAVRLTQVFNNILHNASKFTAQGGQIACVAAVDDADAVVRIRDTGVGIAPDRIATVFEMFTQLGDGVDGADEGLGIGLTLARKLVEMHGGSIAAESAGRGKGSEFVVRLPGAALSHQSAA